MLKSMTGFGRSEVTEGDRKVTVEMKSVNHRYLELGIKLPRKLNFLESAVRNEMKKYVQRGKIDVFVTYENLGEGSESIRYNKELAREYYDCFAQISEDLGIDNDIKTSFIVKSPDVITVESGQDDEEVIQSLVISAIDQATEKLVETRRVEGEHLKKDLISKLDDMVVLVEKITEKSPVIVEEYKEKITTRINELLDEASIDEARIAQEVTIFADKICVDEELVRLDSHIKTMKDTLIQGGAVGRRLDFIAQEMNREANTTLSKTTDAEISDMAIELKTEIEKVREQIQNIE